MMGKSSHKRTPRDLLRVVFRHSRLFLVGAALFAILAMIGSTFLSKKYTGTAKFQRRMDPAAENIRGARSESFDSRKRTLPHELAGRDAVREAAEDLGLFKGEEFPRTPSGELTDKAQRAKQELVRSLQQNLQVQWEVRSDQVDLIAVSFTHSDPELAQKFPNTVVHNYITSVGERIVTRLEQSEGFLQKQVARCERQLQQAKDELIEFQTESAAMMPDQPGALDQEIRRIQSDIDTVRRQHILARQKLARLERLQARVEEARREEEDRAGEAGGATGSPAAASTQPAGTATQAIALTTRPAEDVPGELSQIVMVRNPKLDELEDQLEAAREQLETMRKVHQMKDKHPQVQAQKRRIAQLTEQIEQTPEQIQQESVYDLRDQQRWSNLDLSVELAAARSEVEMTSGELTRLDRRLADYRGFDYAGVRKKYEQKLEKVASRRNELERWQGRYQDVRMARQAEEGNSRTHHESVLAAQPQYRPSSPSLGMILAFAVVGGVAFGGGLVFLVNYLDRSIATPEEAAKEFDVPIQGVIGEIVTRRQKVGRGLRKWVGWPIVSGVILAAVSLCALNAVLWLRYPEEYRSWQREPVDFVWNKVTGKYEEQM